MRKAFLTLFVVASAFVLLKLNVLAAEVSTTSYSPTPVEIQVMPPLPKDGVFDLFLGQDHAYSVTFRGNGQAVVFFRAAFSNSGDKALTELTFRFPKIEPEGVAVYQVIREDSCITWDYSKMLPSGQYSCLKYTEPNYYEYYYGPNIYGRAKIALSTDTLTITLPTPIKSQKSGAVIIYFRTFGYTSKDVFGAYTYRFESLKVDDTVRTLRVGISPDSDLFMKGATGAVGYYKESAPAFESSKTMSVGASFRSSSIDTVIQNIGYGSINKESYNLMPLDSYTVSGSYASTVIALYAKLIIGIIVSLILILLITGGVSYKLYKYRMRKRVLTDSVGGGKNVDTVFKGVVMSLGLSFGSAFFTSITIFLGFLFLSSINSWSYGGGMYNAAYILSIIMIFGLVAVFMLFPTIIVGVKKGIWWCFVNFSFTLFFLFIITFLMVLLFAGLRSLPSTFVTPLR